MASPFSIFRKYQATLLAVFGVALMVAFVVLPAVIQLQQSPGGRGYTGDAVVTWTGGEMTEADLSGIMQRRQVLGEFLLRLQEAAQAKQGGDEMNLRRESEVLQQLLNNNNPETALQTIVLAQKARDMGMAVDEQAILRFLHRVTDNTFLNDEELLAEARAAIGRKTSMAAIYDAIREELLAAQVRAMSPQGGVTTPSDAWAYYNRLNRTVTAEFVPFRVEDYIDQVAEPTDRQIEEYYEKYKHDYPNPTSPEPGFKERRKVEFHYLVADVDEFLKEEKAKVTRAEIEEYYQANKDSFRETDAQGDDGQGDVDELPSQDPAGDGDRDADDPRKAAPRPPVVPGSLPPQVEAAEPDSVDDGAEQGAVEEIEPAVGDEAAENRDDAEDAAREPADGQPGSEGEEGSPGEAGSDSATPSEDPSEDPSEATTDDAAPTDTPPGDKSAPAEVTVPAEEAEAADDETETAGDQRPANEDQPEEDGAGETSNGPDAAGDDEDAAGNDPGEARDNSDLDAPEPMQRYKPLEEVEDQIRQALAAPRAQQRVDEAIEEARKALATHFEKTIELELQGVEEKPTFDGEALAERFGLEFRSTGLQDPYSLYEAREKHEIALSSRRRQGARPEQFLDLGFVKGLPNYQPMRTELQTEIEDKVFLAWKVNEVEARVPELEEIRDEVVKAWKMEQAREIAASAAKELAAGVDGDQPLEAQVDEDREVITPPEFSYADPIDVYRFMLQIQQFQRGMGGLPQLTPAGIEGVEDAGTDAVVREVIQMPVGSVRVVPNADKSTYFVVRVAGETTGGNPREEFLKTIADNLKRSANAPLGELPFVGLPDRQRLYGNWYRSIEEEYEVRRLDPEFFQRGS